jgi:hypothetical protein
MARFELTVNGDPHVIEADPATPLLAPSFGPEESRLAGSTRRSYASPSPPSRQNGRPESPIRRARSNPTNTRWVSPRRPSTSAPT